MIKYYYKILYFYVFYVSNHDEITIGGDDV